MANFRSIKFDFFLDRRGVMDAFDKSTKKVFFRIGAFSRTVMKNLFKKPGKKRGKHSRPGQPPFRIEGSIHRLTFFALDPSARSVVTGPMKFSGSNVLQLLNEGGRAVRFGRNVVYEPRPFVEPTMDKTLPRVPGFWKDQIGK